MLLEMQVLLIQNLFQRDLFGLVTDTHNRVAFFAGIQSGILY